MVEQITRLLFSPEEVGRKLGVSRTTIYKLLAGGKLKSIKVGGRRRISQRAIDTFIQQQEEGSSFATR